MNTKVWRLIDTGHCSASYNMAVDEAVAEFVSRGKSQPTLRLYGWECLSASLGLFQKIEDINLQYCISHEIPVVRRPTGGRAILHGEELTYSFSSQNEEPFSGSLMETYYKLGVAFQKAFRAIGLHTTMKQERESGRNLSRSPLCFRSTSYGEISFNGKKIMGSAQRRWNNGFLQQGSIPYIVDDVKIRRIFNIAGSDLRGYPSGLKDALPDQDPQMLKEAIRLSFEEEFGVNLFHSPLSDEEHLLALRLEVQKYQRTEWNFQRKGPQQIN